MGNSATQLDNTKNGECENIKTKAKEISNSQTQLDKKRNEEWEKANSKKIEGEVRDAYEEADALVRRMKIEDRAEKKIDKAMKEIEEEERGKLLICGLDPVAVYESLTKSIQECFESDIEKLFSKVHVELPEFEIEKYIKRCAASRVKRMAEFNEKKQKLENEVKMAQKKLHEKKMPWNVDTISKEGWSSTEIDESTLSEKEREKLYSDFINENETKINHVAMLDGVEECRLYLLDEPQLICEETVNYLTRRCFAYELAGKSELMIQSSQKVINFRFIFEMAKQLDCDPRSCFARFCMDPEIINYTQDPFIEKEYFEAHENALKAFCEPIKKLAKKKLDYTLFVIKNEEEIKHFAMLSKAEDCRTYLLDEPQLVCEETFNELKLWCLHYEITEKRKLLIHVSKQAVLLQFILEFGEYLDCGPKSYISSFFKRIQTAEKEYLAAYEDELKAFRKRIKDRAKEKIDKAMKEIEEEEREKRFGPGGLDPADLFESWLDQSIYFNPILRLSLKCLKMMMTSHEEMR